MEHIAKNGVGRKRKGPRNSSNGATDSASSRVESSDNTNRGSPSEVAEKKTYQTYTKLHPETGETYSGMTSGTGRPRDNVAKRDKGHHKNEEGFGPAVLDQSSDSYEAIRGREQTNIDYNGGSRRSGGSSGNEINGVSPQNKKRDEYRAAEKREFGDEPPAGNGPPVTGTSYIDVETRADRSKR